MYWFLRLHYLLFFPVMLAIPVISGYILSRIPLNTGIVIDDFSGLLIGIYYLCFFVGQVVLFVLIRTRTDVRLSRTFGSYDAWLFTLLYILMLVQPLFVTGYNNLTAGSIPSFAGRYLGFLFSNSSDVVSLVLLLVIFVLYAYISRVVFHERVEQTGLEFSLNRKL